MVLHRANFEILAEFRFFPFEARWKVARAELLGWSCLDEPRLGLAFVPMMKPIGSPLDRGVQVAIEVPDYSTSGMLGGGLGALYGGLGEYRVHTVEMDRLKLPPDVLLTDESAQNTPEIAGRCFELLICEKPEFADWLPSVNVKPGAVKKNPWAMLNDFFELGEEDWIWNLRGFLNRWGLWSREFGFTPEFQKPRPFVVVFPHQVKKTREFLREGMLAKNARRWLSTTEPLSLQRIDTPPHFVVESCYCNEAMKAAITIEHLAGRRWGFCKRCHKLFEQETHHKKNYCDRRCIQAAGVQRWRDKQRKARRSKGGERNAKD